jgi:hypothetical protein
MSFFTKLFGGSRSKNTNNKYLRGQLDSTIGSIGGTSNLLGSLLGIGDPTAGAAGFGNYRKNAGFDFQMLEGLKGITGSAAARGILNSGMTGKAYTKYGNELQKTFYDDYIKQLLGFGGMGIGAAGVLADTGKKSSEDTGAFGKMLGSILSDRRFKKGIELIRRLDNGLNWYRFSYKWEDTIREGLMADEVAAVRPEAVSSIDGISVVNYDIALRN